MFRTRTFRTRRAVCAPLVALVAACGCAVVDPGEDYERTGQTVYEATGRRELYRPGGDDASSGQRIETLLEGGLSETEAVEVGLLGSPTLRGLLIDVGLAHANLVQAGLLSNPTLTGVVRFPVDGGKTAFEAGLAQNLLELWQRPARQRLSEHRLEQTVLRVASEAVHLVAATRSAYQAAVAADALLDVEEQNVESARTFLELVLARQEAGAATEVNVNVARADLLDQEVVLRTARLSAFEARRRLALLLGLETSPADLELTDVAAPLPVWSVDLERLLALAREHRLDLRAAREGLLAAEQAVSLERRLFLRSASVGADLEIEDGDVSLGPSVSLELPVFDQNQAGVARAELRREQARQRVVALGVTVSQEVRGVHARLLAALDIALAYQERILPLNEANLELARESFLAGKTGVLDVLTAQRQLLAARRGVIERRAAVARLVPELEASCGRTLEAILAAGAVPERTNTNGAER